MNAQEALRALLSGEGLDRVRMESLTGRIMDGEVEPPLQAALLVALAMKGESAEEILGAAVAMRQRATPVPHGMQGLVDTCGTGGDGAGTFNISTTAAFVAAAAGVPVAKHGNRSVSSRSGSADVLTALGVELDMSPESVARALREIGIAFLFAPRYHPAMKAVMPVRQALKVRTIFNLLGPLTNPAGATRQVVGVYSAELVPLVAEVLAELGTEHALVVHGLDGLDEITLTGPTLVGEVRAGSVSSFEIAPEDLGLPRAAAGALRGGSPSDNASIVREVLSGQAGPRLDVVLLNATAAIYVGGRTERLESGLDAAREAIASGAAAATLEKLRKISPAGVH